MDNGGGLTVGVEEDGAEESDGEKGRTTVTEQQLKKSKGIMNTGFSVMVILGWEVGVVWNRGGG